MNGINFRAIAPRCGGEREAFEELCCQVARRAAPPDSTFVRLHGAGGDGGVECFADLQDGERIGWQAKYVFNIDSLITQATESLTTALAIHDSLTRYIVCFPFNLTGPTGRRGRSALEKFEEWREARQREAAESGRTITIEAWPESELLAQLLDVDVAGGIQTFFFDEMVLSPEWFEQHIETAMSTAGPRYTPELNVETELGQWFSAFGRTEEWADQLTQRTSECRGVHKRLHSATRRTGWSAMSPAWPEESRDEAQETVTRISALLDACDCLSQSCDSTQAARCIEQLHACITALGSHETGLADELNAQHEGRADSPGYRQFMAEYECSFPTANLDDARDMMTALRALLDWLESPSGGLGFQHAFVLTGVTGSGKTHGVCDAARQRLAGGKLTVVGFGHTFGGEPEPWVRLRDWLGLPGTLGEDRLLDALDSAAEASGHLLFLFIDAINDTRPRRYWRDRLAAFSLAVCRRRNLRLCFTCRSAFEGCCLPDGHGLPVYEHRGFVGVGHDACREFFEHYDLEPPVAPILQPELANPLYLRLLCETLQSRGLRSLPAGWRGLAPVISAFLDEKERRFSDDHGTAPGAAVVSGSLFALAREIAASGEPAISWSQAQRIITEARPQAARMAVLEWLVRSDLLIEDAPLDRGLDAETSVRPAFERLGDFLIAEELLSRVDPERIEDAFVDDGPLAGHFRDPEAVEQNRGVAAALAILLPEQAAADTELPCLLPEGPVRDAVLRVTIESFPWRDPGSFSQASITLMREGLATSGFGASAMDAALAVSWRSSVLDAFWLDGFLRGQPLARRDAFWCGFLHDRYENHGPVRRLIEAAFELPLDQVDVEVAERWAIVLLWFTAAADRRVKDWSSRAATVILGAHPALIPAVLRRMIEVDDDSVRERAYLAAYGALLLSRVAQVVQQVCALVLDDFADQPDTYDNAMIRDHARCIVELAEAMDVLPAGADVEALRPPLDTEWPLALPSDDDLERWEDLPKLAHSCLRDDFFIYSMGCLHRWSEGMPEPDMGRWILQQVADRLGFAGSGCERYDEYMLGRFGGGRAREPWAERIGKKYQWIAMYQLAGRLSDHVEPQRDSWRPEPLQQPLILVEERQLDPTLTTKIVDRDGGPDAWWIRAAADLGQTGDVSDEEWLARGDDLPSFEDLLAAQERAGQRWRLLQSYLTWGRFPREEEPPRRQVWGHIYGYLLAKDSAETAYECLIRRNFFGRWMPEGATLLYGFLGEYPWATAFGTEPEDFEGRGRFGEALPVQFMPAWNHFAVEWEDATLPRRFHMVLPARAFFRPRDLWYDGQDGYRLLDGRTIFRDPSVTEMGPSSLLVDADDLTDRLDRLGLRLMWTFLGEKRVVGERNDEKLPVCTFSQVARLHEDGQLETSERTFFEDYDAAKGPLIPATDASG